MREEAGLPGAFTNGHFHFNLSPTITFSQRALMSADSFLLIFTKYQEAFSLLYRQKFPFGFEAMFHDLTHSILTRPILHFLSYRGV